MHLETKRFVLRKLSIEDSQTVFEILKDPDVKKFLNIPEINSASDSALLIKDYLEGFNEGTKFPFAICNKENGLLIGVFILKLDLYDEDCYEYTVYISKEFWNKGVYSEVFPEMIRYAFEKIKTGNVRGFIMKGNTASAIVLQKNEFVLEKTFSVPGIDSLIESYLMTSDYYYEHYKDSHFSL